MKIHIPNVLVISLFCFYLMGSSGVEAHINDALSHHSYNIPDSMVQTKIPSKKLFRSYPAQGDQNNFTVATKDSFTLTKPNGDTLITYATQFKQSAESVWVLPIKK